MGFLLLVRNIGAEHSSCTVICVEKIATVAETAHAAVESAAAYRRPRSGRYYDGCCAQATDEQALEALQYLASREGIIAALESAHAVAEARQLARRLGSGAKILINISGRGDKDVDHLRHALSSQEKPKTKSRRKPR